MQRVLPHLEAEQVKVLKRVLGWPLRERGGYRWRTVNGASTRDAGEESRVYGFESELGACRQARQVLAYARFDEALPYELP